MALRMCVLGSGSSGNCILVASGQTHLLIDAGLSCREIVRRLTPLGVDLASQVTAVCVSHEHDDHKAALRVLQRRHGLDLYANAGTADAVQRDAHLNGLQWNIFTTGSPFTIGDLQLEPFSVPHDSYDPVGFVVSDGTARVGVVTDMGMATELVRQRLRDCHALTMECNHDAQMLQNAPRPWSLKQRIAGRQGHLSNEQAGQLLAEVAGPQLKAVFLVHLSAECNRADLAERSARDALAAAGHSDVAVCLTYPDRASDVIVVGDA